MNRLSVAIALTLARRAFVAAPGSGGLDRARASTRRWRCLPRPTAIRAGQPFRVGLHMKLDRGWHTYWKNPGDAGLPARLKWTLPEGFTAGPIQWPAPAAHPRAAAHELRVRGRGAAAGGDHAARGPRRAGEVTLAVKADWLECRESCLPAKAELDLALPVRPTSRSPAPRRRSSPRRAAACPSSPEGWSLSAEAGPRAVALTFRAAAGLKPAAAYFFPDQPRRRRARRAPGLRAPGRRPPRHPEAGREHAEARPPHAACSWWRAASGRGPIQVDVALASGDPAPAAAMATADAASRWPAPRTPARCRLALGLRVPGRPDPEPHALRAARALAQGARLRAPRRAGTPTHAWRHGLVFTAGVVAVLLGPRGSAAPLPRRGRARGLGLPAPVAALPGRALGPLPPARPEPLRRVRGGHVAHRRREPRCRARSGLAASFWNGVLATIVATPCTAPFMGSALGYALSQPAMVSLGRLHRPRPGHGGALPAVSPSRPGCCASCPRPGPWMEGFKQLMGFFLMATVAALVWLFGQQTGVDGMGVLLAALLVTALGAWVYGRGAGRPLAAGAARGDGRRPGSHGRWAWASASRARLPRRSPAAAGTVVGAGGLDWQEYSAARLAELRREGKPSSSTSPPPGASPARSTSAWPWAAPRWWSASAARASWPCAPTGRAATTTSPRRSPPTAARACRSTCSTAASPRARRACFPRCSPRPRARGDRRDDGPSEPKRFGQPVERRLVERPGHPVARHLAHEAADHRQGRGPHRRRRRNGRRGDQPSKRRPSVESGGWRARVPCRAPWRSIRSWCGLRPSSSESRRAPA